MCIETVIIRKDRLKFFIQAFDQIVDFTSFCKYRLHEERREVDSELSEVINKQVSVYSSIILSAV